MSARVDYTEVEAILGDTGLDSGQITAFIDAASEWIDAYLVCPGIPDLVLAQIEKFLAAYLITTSAEPALIAASRGDISEQYKSGGEHSQYLVAAAAMDPCGIVAEKFMGRLRMKFKIGTTFSAEA